MRPVHDALSIGPLQPGPTRLTRERSRGLRAVAKWDEPRCAETARATKKRTTHPAEHIRLQRRAADRACWVSRPHESPRARTLPRIRREVAATVRRATERQR